MKTDLVRIGNSRGIRIPKPIIEQCGLGDTVELRVENHSLVISPPLHLRTGWSERFRAAGAATDDNLLLESTPPSEFDRQEWRW